MSKQFNLKGINGLYLANKPQVTLNISNYLDNLIGDTDFFPNTVAKSNLYEFKNSRYEDPERFYGSNSKQKANSVYTYSEITKKNELIANKMYYNTFKFYFRYYGTTLNKYNIPGLTAAQTYDILNRLRIKLYVTIGSNQIPMELTNLEKYAALTSTWTPVTTADTSGSDNISAGDYGIQLATGLNSEDCIDMAYPTNLLPRSFFDLFNGYSTAPDGYNFRVDASFPDFNQMSKSGKTYKITVKYLNIGVSGTGPTYSTSESFDMMSDAFVFYEQVPSSLSLLTP